MNSQVVKPQDWPQGIGSSLMVRHTLRGRAWVVVVGGGVVVVVVEVVVVRRSQTLLRPRFIKT
jgi:hypothetical protein